MGLFSSSTEKSTLAQNPVNPDITSQYGSGAEQDRYGSHFNVPTNALNKGVDKLKQAALAKGDGAEQDRHSGHFGIGDKGYDTLKSAARYKGDGAEQDRYHAHFSPALHSRDAQVVKEAVKSIATNGNRASYFGLGYDGQQRAKLLAGSGTGSEQVRSSHEFLSETSKLTSGQDRYGSHFGLTQDTVVSAAKSVQSGAKDMLPKK